MLVEIDEKSGFCFGVVRAISQAEQLISQGRKVYCLGDIVHNRMEVQRLDNLGLKVISYDEFEGLSSNLVLIRAHGEPPKTYALAHERGIELSDATCPVVASLQRQVVKAYEMMQPVGGKVVLLGKRGHAEVVGLIGQVGGDVVVVQTMEELANVDLTVPLYFLSQTTQSLELFNQMADFLKKNASNPDKIVINDTICRQVAGRGPHLKEFASLYDVIIFVSGKKSSNGKVLYGICKEVNERSFFVEDVDELQASWFENCQRVGVCGATSTPKWLMDRILSKIQDIVNQ